MTCIAAIVDRTAKKAWMIGDTQRTIETVISGERGPKITEMTIGGLRCLVGQAGSARAMQLLWHNPLLRSESFDLEAIGDFLIKDWAPALRTLLNDNGQIPAPCPGQVEEPKNQLLIAFPGKLFLIGNGFEVGELTAWDYAAIGEGAPYAFGSLGTSEGSLMPPGDRLNKALEIAVQHSTVVSAPFTQLEL